MKNFDFNCPYCGEILEAEKEWIGMKTECPQCQKVILIQKKRDSWQEAEIAYRKKIFLQRLIVSFIILSITAGICVYVAHRKHVEEQKRIEKKRIAEAKRILEEKRRAEEKRKAEEKLKAETEFIKKELERAKKCKTPMEALDILDKLSCSYSARRNELYPEIMRQHKFYEEAVHIRQAIWRAENSDDYSNKIYILNAVIRRYPLNSYTEEAQKLLLKYKAEQKEAAIKRNEERQKQAQKRKLELRRHAEVESIRRENRWQRSEIKRIRTNRIQEIKPVQNSGGGKFRPADQQRNSCAVTVNGQMGALQHSGPNKCSWCNGSGKRSFSSVRDCSFCLGHGTSMTTQERNHHKSYCMTYKQIEYNCGSNPIFYKRHERYRRYRRFRR